MDATRDPRPSSPGSTLWCGEQLTRTDIRDELRAFADVVLQRHLADLANRVRTDVRKDMEHLLQEHLAGPRGGGERSPGGLRKAGAAWEEDPALMRNGPDQNLTGVNTLRSLKHEGTEHTKVHKVTGGLFEAVLGRESVFHPHSKTVEYRPNSMRAKVKAFVRHRWFERVSSLIIFLNCVFVGVLTDYLARREQQTVPTECHVIEIVFLTIFIVEICLRLYVFREKFFSCQLAGGRPNHHMSWNIHDLIVTCLQVAEVVFTPFSSRFGTLEKVSVLRVLRLVRLFRIVRLIKVLRWVGDLRMIAYGIWRSMSLFFWAIMALLIMNFVCSVYFTDLVLTKKLEGSLTHQHVNKYFGSLGSTMLSLFMALNGGRNWGDLTDVLGDTMDIWVMWPFLFYIAFTLYAVLNVITGVFLETAMESARNEKEVYVVCNARMVFQAADQNGNGTITWPDLERALKHKDVRSFFDAVDIEISEAKALFDLLDIGNDGFISSDEFINGCLRVRGPSKSLDLLVLQREVSQLFEKHSHRHQKQAAYIRNKRATAALHWITNHPSLASKQEPRRSERQPEELPSPHQSPVAPITP